MAPRPVFAAFFNQDPLGRQGVHVGATMHSRQAADVWAKPLADGSIAVGLFNLGEREQRRAMVAWESIGLHDRRPCLVRDLWAHEDSQHLDDGTYATRLRRQVPGHGVVMLRVTPVVP